MAILTPLYLKLIKQLDRDHKYGAIDNTYKQMDYLVKKRARLLAKFGARIMDECRQQEREHGKSRSMADFYISHNVSLVQEHKAAALSESQWQAAVAGWDKALLYLPLDWNDLSSMLPFFYLYLARAQCERERKAYQKTIECLLHAISVFSFFNEPSLIIDHFECQDQDLLLSMLGLMTAMLDHIEETLDSETRQRASQVMNKTPTWLRTRDDVADAFETIREMDSIFDCYLKSLRIDDSPDLHGRNYDLTKKVKISSSEYGGRFFSAVEYISEGETILCEEPQAMVLFHAHLLTHCNHCHRPLTTFWPCGRCIEVAYCSAQCSVQAFAQYHRQECGLLQLMLDEDDFYSIVHAYRMYVTFGIETMVECEDHEKRANDGKDKHFDLNQYLNSNALREVPFTKQSPEERKLLCRALISLVSNRGKRDNMREYTHTSMAVALLYMFIYKGLISEEIVHHPELCSRLLEHMAIQMHRICTNGFAWSKEETTRKGEPIHAKLASCICLTSSFINHSCLPNVDWEISAKGVIYLTARQSIAPGEALTTCYGPRRNTPFWDRQYRLYGDYCFFCHCEVCMKDAANASDSLRCPNPDGQCSGPLVINPYNACIGCAYRLPEDLLRPMKNSVKIVKHCSKDFMHTFRKLTNYQDTKASCFMFRKKKKRTEKLKSEDDDETSQRLLQSGMQSDEPLRLKTRRITENKVHKLEKNLGHLASVAFSGGYNLLSKCVLLLKVYHEVDLHERGMPLMSLLSSCVKHIYPELTDSELVGLVYYLEFAAFFCEQLICKSGEEKLQELQTLSNALNHKLLDILQYDMSHRGEFLPDMHSRLKAQSRNDGGGDEDGGDHAELTKSEQYFRKVYSDAQRRLWAIELLTNQ